MSVIAQFLNGRDALSITDFTANTHGSHLEIVEMILLQQALYLGGETRPVEFSCAVMDKQYRI